jgi:hypothetical protein
MTMRKAMCAMLPALVAAGLLTAVPAQARHWPATSAKSASDYALIVDRTNKTDVTIVMWIADPMAAKLYAKMPSLQQALKDYIVIGTLHAHGEMGSDGKPAMVFGETPPPVAMDAAGVPLKPVAAGGYPAEVTAVTSIVQVMLKNKLNEVAKTSASDAKGKALAEAGQSLDFQVFESGGVQACTPGRLTVAYAGENYTYDTPMPGCPNK